MSFTPPRKHSPVSKCSISRGCAPGRPPPGNWPTGAPMSSRSNFHRSRRERHGRAAARTRFPEPSPQQAEPHAQSERGRRHRDLQTNGRNRRCRDRELPAGRKISPRDRLRDRSRDQQAHRLWLDFGLWRGRSLSRTAGLRPDRAGHGRVDVDHGACRAKVRYA